MTYFVCHWQPGLLSCWLGSPRLKNYNPTNNDHQPTLPKPSGCSSKESKERETPRANNSLTCWSMSWVHPWKFMGSVSLWITGNMVCCFRDLWTDDGISLWCSLLAKLETLIIACQECFIPKRSADPNISQYTLINIHHHDIYIYNMGYHDKYSFNIPD